MPSFRNKLDKGTKLKGRGLVIPTFLVLLSVTLMVVMGITDREREVDETIKVSTFVDAVGRHRMLAMKLEMAVNNLYLGRIPGSELQRLALELAEVHQKAALIAADSDTLDNKEVSRGVAKLGMVTKELIAASKEAISLFPALEITALPPKIAEFKGKVSSIAENVVGNASEVNARLSDIIAPQKQAGKHLYQDTLSALIILTLAVYVIFIILPARARMRAESERLASLSEEMWKMTLIARRTTNAVIITDVSGRIEWVNDGFETITGYKLVEVKGCKPGSFLQCEETDPATVREIAAAVAARRPIQTEILNRTKNGDHYWLSLDIQPLLSEEGDHIGFMAIESEITAYKRVTADLVAVNADLNTMSELSRVGAWSVNLATSEVNWSQHLYEIHEVGPEFRPTLESALSFYPEAAQEAVRSGLAKCLETGIDWDDELPFVTATGRPLRVRVFGRVERLNGAPVKIYGALKDVTELAEARDEAIKAHARLELAASCSGMGLWEWDVQYSKSFTSPAWWKHMGLDQFEARRADFLSGECIHPADHPVVQMGRKAFLEGQDQQLNIEYRQLDGYGEWRWVSLTGQATERSATGAVMRAHGVITDIQTQKLARDEVRYAACHDLMTGLLNRHEMQRIVDEELLTTWPSVGILVIDLDRFKQINDTFGHSAGDHVLKTVSRRIRDNLRASDIAARLGGDEFCVAISCPDDNKEFAVTVSMRLLSAISMPIDFNGTSLAVGVSIGAALAPEHGAGFDTLLINADMALYRVKANGRNGYRLFDDDIMSETTRRRRIELDLAGAIERNELSLVFQKQVRLSDGALMAAEALLRWCHPSLGLVGPDQFIPIAEETGLIVPIGNWVIEEACKQAATWDESIIISINLSASQLGKSNLYDTMVQALNANNLAASRLEIEVTESVFLHDDPALLSDLIKLHDLGVNLALDDFGTGYASLSYLQRLPFDKIKLDRSFVASLGQSNSAHAIISGIAQLASNLGVKTTAEGIETAAQYKILAECGYTLGQGYFIGKPASSSMLFSNGPDLTNVAYPFKR